MTEKLQETHEALNTMREEIKKLVPNQAVIKKCNDFLDGQETKNQNLTKSLLEEKKSREELEEKMISLEAELKRGSLGGDNKEAKTLELKAFESFMREGKSIDREEAKYLRTDSNERGGFLAPTDYISDIIKEITEISPIRQLAKVVPTSRKSITIPKETGKPSFTWLGEGESIAAADASFGSEEIFVNKGGIRIEITQEMLDDTMFNMRSEISSMTAIQVAKGEGQAFTVGAGGKEPQGLLTNTSVGTYNSGNASELTGNALFGIQGEIKTGYDIGWLFNRKTLNQHIRTLKDGNGQYLLQMGLGSIPNTVAGLTYTLVNDMPDVAADTFPIICGDIFKAYTIADNRQIRFLEDPYSSAGADKITFYVFKRTGGQVTLPEAMKKLKIAL